MATRNGLEPSTSSVTGWRANRLHHRAKYGGNNRARTCDPMLVRHCLLYTSQRSRVLLRAHYDTALSEDRSLDALRWSGLSALYDLYTRDQFTPQDPAPASQSMEEDGGRALWEAALPVHVESLAKALGLEAVSYTHLRSPSASVYPPW